MDNTKCYSLPFPKVSISVISGFCELSAIAVCHTEYLFAYQSSIIHRNTGSACYWVTTILHVLFSPLTLFFFPFFPFVSGNKPTFPEITEIISVLNGPQGTRKYIYIYVYCQQYVGIHFPIILVGNCSSIIT